MSLDAHRGFFGWSMKNTVWECLQGSGMGDSREPRDIQMWQFTRSLPASVLRPLNARCPVLRVA